jgi:hypothetical protein
MELYPLTGGDLTSGGLTSQYEGAQGGTTGWVLQERVLSPRTVYFSRDEIFWECGTHIASESAAWDFDKNGKNLLVKFKSVNGPPDLYRGPDFGNGEMRISRI